jgi:LysM repeat protein
MGGRPDTVAPLGRSNRTVTPAIAAALVVLAASFALSVAFVLANGGLDLPAAQRPSESALAATSPGLGATATAAVETSARPASGAPEASAPPSGPSPSSPSTATAAPTLTAAPSPTPSVGPTARPSSNRYDLLSPCPNAPDCWIYVVRQGDNLFSIARYFGVPLSVVEERNPWTRTTPLVAGQKLLLPPPTR